MHITSICTVLCNLHWFQIRVNNSVDYRESKNFMYVYLWATQSMNQEFIIKRLKTVKT